MTRAKDRLILSGAGAGTQSSWWKFIDEALKTDETLRSQVNDLPFQKVEPALRRAEEVRSGDGADRQRVDEAISRVRQPTLTPSRSVVLPVTHLQDLLRCPRRFHYLHHLGLSDVSTRSGFESEKSLEGDARTLGSIAHRMIELTDLSWPRQPGLRDKLKTRLLAEGLSPESRDGQELLQWVERFWMTPFAQRICRTEGSLFKRELPFMLTLSSPRGFSLHVRGQIDLLWLDEQGVARVVDYKFSRRPPTGLEPYRFQLACYALATRRLLGNGVKVEAGVSFLRDDAEPEFFQEDTLLSGQVEQGLLSAVGDLLEVKASGEWPGQPEERCRQMACGFVARCHARN